jgi:hypothetical protein
MYYFRSSLDVNHLLVILTPTSHDDCMYSVGVSQWAYLDPYQTFVIQKTRSNTYIVCLCFGAADPMIFINPPKPSTCGPDKWYRSTIPPHSVPDILDVDNKEAAADQSSWTDPCLPNAKPIVRTCSSFVKPL